MVYGLQFIAVGAWTAFAAPYFGALGLSLAVIGVLVAVPSAIAIIVAPMWGLAADRLGDMRLPYLVAAILAAGSGLALAARPPMPWLAVAVLILSVGSAGLTPLLDSRTIQRLWPRRERFGQARVAGSISFMVGTVGTGLVIEATRLEAMFVIYAIALVTAGVAAVALLGRPMRSQRVGTVGPIAAIRLLRLPGLGLFFVGSCVMWVNAIGSMALFSLRVEELAGDTAFVGIGWAISAVFEIPVMLLFARLAARVGVGRLIFIGSLLFILRAVLWSISTTPLMFIAVTSLGGCGFALALVGTTSYIASRVPAQLLATSQALFGSTTFAFGAIAGSILAGQVANAYGLAAVYPVGGAVATVGAVLIGLALGQGARATQGWPPPVSGSAETGRTCW